MSKKEIINQVKEYVKKQLRNEPTGHDWWHAQRVWKLSKKIAKEEGGNLFIIEIAALLHDISDWKFNNGHTTKGIKKIKSLLKGLEVDKEDIKLICDIVGNIYFKGAKVKSKVKIKEARIVQDADRLDALGAIGIARTFAYGGFIKREIYNPGTKVKLHKSVDEYRKAKSTSINHFHEKLLLIKDRLNTKTAKSIAKERHEFLKIYLRHFLKEWKTR